jgi:hypothetical protein
VGRVPPGGPVGPIERQINPDEHRCGHPAGPAARCRRAPVRPATDPLRTSGPRGRERSHLGKPGETRTGTS